MNTALTKLYDTCRAAGLTCSLREDGNIIVVDWSETEYSLLGVLPDDRVFHINAKTGTEIFDTVEETMENITG